MSESVVDKLSTRVAAARAIALEAHGTQKYGDHPYVYHLDQVAELVGRNNNKYNEDLQIIAYFHDIMEDTQMARRDLREMTTPRIMSMVDILTDLPNTTRKERKQIMNARLSRITYADGVEALIVKTADRLANVREANRTSNTGLLSMYANEHDEFKEACRRPGLCEDWWSEMDSIITLWKRVPSATAQPAT